MPGLGIFVLTFAILLGCAKSDTISNRTANLTIILETLGPNLIRTSDPNASVNYLRFNSSLIVKISCTKHESLGNGSFAAFVNTKVAQPISCVATNSIVVSNCSTSSTKKEDFEYELESDRSTYFEILCKFSTQARISYTASLNFLRVFDDTLPRVRNGLTLSSANATLTHYVNLETIGCEAIRKYGEVVFDSVDWFMVDTAQILAANRDEAKVSRIIDQDHRVLLNYSRVFPATSRLIKNNTYYRCCTTLSGQIKECQQFLAVFYAPFLATNDQNSIVQNGTGRETVVVSSDAVRKNLWFSSSQQQISDATSRNESGVMRDGVMVKNGACHGCQAITPTPISSTSNPFGNAEVGIIIAIIGGAIILTLLIILLFLCCRRYRRTRIYKGTARCCGSEKGGVVRINQYTERCIDPCAKIIAHDCRCQCNSQKSRKCCKSMSRDKCSCSMISRTDSCSIHSFEKKINVIETISDETVGRMCIGNHHHTNLINNCSGGNNHNQRTLAASSSDLMGGCSSSSNKADYISVIPVMHGGDAEITTKFYTSRSEF